MRMLQCYLHCRRCLEVALVIFFLEVEIEPNVKVEYIFKFSYLGDTLGVGVEAARARVRFHCAWAKFKELSPILTAFLSYW